MNSTLKNVQGKSKFRLETGDIVFCFTDGLYEQKIMEIYILVKAYFNF